MRQDFFEFIPQFKLLIAGNYKPGLRNVDEAMRRRLHLIPFEVTIPVEERDKDLATRLRAEHPGILAWAIEGCLAWQRVGLSPPPIVANATAKYLEEEDSLAAWMDDCCTTRTTWTAGNTLFANWVQWCEQGDEYPGSRKRFSQSLEARGFAPQKNMGVRGFLGIGLKS